MDPSKRHSAAKNRTLKLTSSESRAGAIAIPGLVQAHRFAACQNQAQKFRVAAADTQPDCRDAKYSHYYSLGVHMRATASVKDSFLYVNSSATTSTPMMNEAKRTLMALGANKAPQPPVAALVGVAIDDENKSSRLEERQRNLPRVLELREGQLLSPTSSLLTADDFFYLSRLPDCFGRHLSEAYLRRRPEESFLTSPSNKS